MSIAGANLCPPPPLCICAGPYVRTTVSPLVLVREAAVAEGTLSITIRTGDRDSTLRIPVSVRALVCCVFQCPACAGADGVGTGARCSDSTALTPRPR